MFDTKPLTLYLSPIGDFHKLVRNYLQAWRFCTDDGTPAVKASDLCCPHGLRVRRSKPEHPRPRCGSIRWVEHLNTGADILNGNAEGRLQPQITGNRERQHLHIHVFRRNKADRDMQQIVRAQGGMKEAGRLKRRLLFKKKSPGLRQNGLIL